MTTPPDSAPDSGTPITPPAGFPVEWDDEEEPTLLWSWDNFHAPLPVSPMSQSLGRATARGAEAASKALGRAHGGARRKLINGYTYSSGAPPTEKQRKRAAELTGRAIEVTRKRWDEEWVPELERDLNEMREIDLEALSGEQLLTTLDRYLERLARHWEIHFLVVFPVGAAVDRLDDLCSEITGTEKGSIAYKLLDSSQTKTVEVNQAVSQLAARARALPAAARAIREVEPTDAVLAALDETADGRRWLGALGEFLDVYGYRPTGFDLRYPTWIEDPTFVLLNVRGELQAGNQARAVHSARRGLAAERAALLADLRERLFDNPARLAEFEAKLARAQELWPLKEDHAFYIDHAGTAHARLLIAEIGRRLARRGLLDWPDDVFFLELGEAREALRSGGGRQSEVAVRRAEIDKWSRMNPPRYLGALPAEGAPDEARAALAALAMERPSVLRGQAASAGDAKGPARVVMSSDEFGKVRPGDILVCRSTAATWTPLFSIVAGLVSEAGGVLSHPAVIAREQGLPAVVGVPRATELIADGDGLAIDGRLGVVRLA